MLIKFFTFNMHVCTCYVGLQYQFSLTRSNCLDTFLWLLSKKKEKFEKNICHGETNKKNWGRYSTLMWPLRISSIRTDNDLFIAHTNNPLQATIFHRIIFAFNTYKRTYKTAYWECDEGKYPISVLIFAGVGIKELYRCFRGWHYMLYTIIVTREPIIIAWKEIEKVLLRYKCEFSLSLYFYYYHHSVNVWNEK